MPARLSPSEPTARAGPLYKRAIENIERMMGEVSVADGQELLQKEVALGIGMSESVFSQKMRGIRSHFYEDEFESIAVWFRRRTGRPLIGFPHLDWQLMESCDRKVAGWKP
jgi:hypothetical protein